MDPATIMAILQALGAASGKDKGEGDMGGILSAFGGGQKPEQPQSSFIPPIGAGGSQISMGRGGAGPVNPSWSQAFMGLPQRQPGYAPFGPMLFQ